MGPAIIAALGSMASNMMSSQLNKHAAEESNMRNLRNWHEMASYNSPKNQVERLRQAGINPALALQNGAMDSGSLSSPPPESVTPNYDFSPSSQAFMQSAELYQQKRLQDAQIAGQEAVTQNQLIRNKTQLLHDLSEIMDKMADKSLKENERSYYEWLANNLMKDYESYDERVGSEIDLRRAQENESNAHSDYLEAQASYQRILNQYEPKQREIISKNLELQGREIESAINKNNADAAHSAALKALTDAQKEGVYMENDIKEEMANYIVDEQAAKADEQFWKAQESAKTYRQGSAVSNLVPGNNPNGTIGYQSKGYVRHHVRWKRSKKK